VVVYAEVFQRKGVQVRWGEVIEARQSRRWQMWNVSPPSIC